MKKRWELAIAIGTIIAGIALGWLAFAYYPGSPIVSIIAIEGSIDEESRLSIERALGNAGSNASVAAVVLAVESTGGQAVDSEELYYAILQLRTRKPVIAVANTAVASGAYYASVAANKIFVKPSTLVGSIGGVSVLPERTPLPEARLVTGPFKRQDDPREVSAQVQQTVESFLNAVIEQRGDKLKIGRQELAQARIYTGIDAVRLGLVDAVGTEEDALNAAAEMAGIAHYRVADSRASSAGDAADRLSVNASMLRPTNTIPVTHLVYVTQ